MSEFLYEKIANISDYKNRLVEENSLLLSQVESLQKQIEVDFIERLNKILEGIEVDETTGTLTVLEEKVKEEVKLAHYFIGEIKKRSNGDKDIMKKIAELILQRIG